MWSLVNDRLPSNALLSNSDSLHKNCNNIERGCFYFYYPQTNSTTDLLFDSSDISDYREVVLFPETIRRYSTSLKLVLFCFSAISMLSFSTENMLQRSEYSVSFITNVTSLSPYVSFLTVYITQPIAIYLYICVNIYCICCVQEHNILFLF